ncbi:MAG TPA: hypothetical protein VLB68_03265 [Pyrinomonadaceae bacterium]|nr:hypothetical protein [Pyrinomonadaceae bacterium]
MKKYRYILTTIAILGSSLMITSAIQAQATRTWVSGVGDDANPCSRTAPCKTYAGAISKTAKDGEISTLDPGGFGAVTITKSITINGGGAGQGYGSILASLVNGVIINITDVNDVRKTVRLDWLNINGASTGLNGIRFIAGNTLFVENTIIDGFTTHGIDVNTASTTFLHVKNTTIRNCGGSGISTIAGGANQVAFAFTGISIHKCGTGFNAQNGTRGSMRDSFFALNTTGIALSQSGSNTEVNIDSSQITGSSTAISVNTTSRARIARCTISQNANAFGLSGGFVDTGGNNTIFGNTTNQAPNGTVFPQN